jgi:FkbM family methyltransferase
MPNPFRAIKNGLKLNKHFKKGIFLDYMSKLAQLQHTPKIIETKEGYTFEVTTASDYLLIREMMEDMYGKIEKDWYVVDIGAQKGVFTVRAATTAKEVHSYEPCEESFNTLNKNVDLNHLTNVHANMKAVAGSKGTMNLILSKSSLTHSLYQGIGEPTGEVQKVEVVTLDDVAIELPKIDFLKVDCEGSEYEMFYKAKPWTIDKIQKFMIELHPHNEYTNEGFIKFLEKRGFEVKPIKIGGYVHLFGKRIQ